MLDIEEKARREVLEKVIDSLKGRGHIKFRKMILLAVAPDLLRCARCHRLKPRNLFTRCKVSSTGRHSYCDRCRAGISAKRTKDLQ